MRHNNCRLSLWCSVETQRRDIRQTRDALDDDCYIEEAPREMRAVVDPARADVITLFLPYQARLVEY